MAEKRVGVGCQFWPRRGGPFFLTTDGSGPGGWDRGEVAAELAHVADLGLDFVRVGVAWDVIQPEGSRLRTSVVGRLESFLTVVADAGLRLHLTLFGRLGATLLVPRWLLATEPEHARLESRLPLLSEGWAATLPLLDLYVDPRAVDGQRYLWSELGRLFGGHPALARVDPGCGGLLTALPPRRAADAQRWWQEITSGMELATGYSDGADLLRLEERPPLEEWSEQVVRLGIALSPTASPLATGPHDAGWPRFLHLLSQTLAGAPVSAAPVGAPGGPDGGDEAQARFVGEVLPALAAAGAPELTYVLWADSWGEHRDRPPFATTVALDTSGLLDGAGGEKQAAVAMREVAAALHDQPVATPATLALEPAEWRERRGDMTWVGELYREWRGGPS